MTTAIYLYKCKHCNKKFIKEKPFISHECKELRRSHEIQTAVGQQAYQLYKLWLEKQRRSAPAIDTFISSAFYTSFLKFTRHARELGINDYDLWISLMVKEELSPALWIRDEPYSWYIQHLDKKMDPYESTEKTLQTLLNISEKIECDLADVFSKLVYGEIIDLINKHQLSPWVLFCSTTFKNRLSQFEQAEKDNILKTLGASWWVHTLESKPEVVKEIKNIVASLGL